MKLAVAIPIKPLNQAKSRLRPGLDDTARQKLVLTMLRHVLAVVAASSVIEAGGVVSADPAALALARQFGLEAVAESRPKGYNSSVVRASAWAQARGCDALLILPADLPFLTTSDIRSIHDLGDLCSRCVVIAPDANFAGTNALLLRPPDVITPAFGPDSARQHRKLARQKHLSTIFYTAPTLSHDIDLPSDLTLLPEYIP